MSKYFLFKHIDKDLSLAYLEAKQQVTSNKLKHAKDYEQLFNKYKKDINKFCTRYEIANHYFNISKKFYLSKDYEKSNTYIKMSLKYNLKIKSLIIFFILLIRKF